MRELDIDSFHSALDEVAEEIPAELLRELNGGIMVLPEIKYHPGAPAGDLFVMGEYHVQIPGLGRFIVMYYGSFECVFGASTPNESPYLRTEIRRTLIHELRHHVESLSGVKDLEREDERTLEAYHLRRQN
jgi:hypothetical protein